MCSSMALLLFFLGEVEMKNKNQAIVGAVVTCRKGCQQGAWQQQSKGL